MYVYTLLILPAGVRVVTLMLLVNPGPALLMANIDTSYTVVLLRPMKLVLLSVVTFSVISCTPSDNVTLYVTPPQALWLNVSHKTTNESSDISVIAMFGGNGGPI